MKLLLLLFQHDDGWLNPAATTAFKAWPMTSVYWRGGLLQWILSPLSGTLHIYIERYEGRHRQYMLRWLQGSLCDYTLFDNTCA